MDPMLGFGWKCTRTIGEYRASSGVAEPGPYPHGTARPYCARPKCAFPVRRCHPAKRVVTMCRLATLMKTQMRHDWNGAAACHMARRNILAIECPPAPGLSPIQRCET